MESLYYNISFYSFIIAGALIILMGSVYATRSQVMPYHLKALETSWGDIDMKFQFMLKMLINGGGFSGLSSGIFIMVLVLIPFKEGQAWAGYAIGIIGLVGVFPLTMIVYKVKTQTRGNPPMWLLVLMNGLLFIGLISHIMIN